jgi:hypothetical protein
MSEAGAFTCPICRRVSHHPRDRAERYCGVCGFVDDVMAPTDRARAAYHDDAMPERTCDNCGQPYRGPAVYCSLGCAIEDAA